MKLMNSSPVTSKATEVDSYLWPRIPMKENLLSNVLCKALVTLECQLRENRERCILSCAVFYTYIDDKVLLLSPSPMPPHKHLTFFEI